MFSEGANDLPVLNFPSSYQQISRRETRLDIPMLNNKYGEPDPSGSQQ